MTESNQTLTISFFRPEYKNVNIAITITKLENYTDAVENEIKENILNEFADIDIGQTLYASNLYYPILSASGDFSSPSFFINSVSINGGMKVAPTMLQLLTTDVSLITITKNESD